MILAIVSYPFITLSQAISSHGKKQQICRIITSVTMFHVKRDGKGYYCVHFFCEMFPATASVKVKRIIKGYASTESIITLHNLL